MARAARTASQYQMMSVPRTGAPFPPYNMTERQFVEEPYYQPNAYAPTMTRTASGYRRDPRTASSWSDYNPLRSDYANWSRGANTLASNAGYGAAMGMAAGGVMAGYNYMMPQDNA